MKTIEIGEGTDVSPTGAVLVNVPSIVEIMATGSQPDIPGFVPEKSEQLVLNSPAERTAAELTFEVIKQYVENQKNV